MLRHLSLLTTGFLCAVTPAISTEKAAVSTANFNVLSMSVGGIPARFDPTGASPANKNRNTIYIGMIMSLYNYGIINVQEDFAYHRTLYQYDQHPFRTGFTLMRLRMDEGIYIDIINLDANAGVKAGELAARRSNIEQIVGFIEANSAGNAVIAFGNTNSLYTRADDNIRLFTTRNNLTDAWIEAAGGNVPIAGSDSFTCPKGAPASIGCEVTDKIFYRGSPIINLTSFGFYYDTSRFRSPEGSLLTDRNPVRVEFGWSLKPGLRQSDLYGGPHGTWFNDINLVPSSARLSSITLRGGNRLNGITLTLVSGHNFTHGGSGGTASLLDLVPGEYITSVDVCWGKKNLHTRNFYAAAVTNKGRVVKAGKMTTECSTAVAPKGYGVVGTYGQDGDEMDRLGFIYAPQ